ncbi:hypothetical protein ACHAXR_000548, partial [Thalassiosira sp. AJA248-18]
MYSAGDIGELSTGKYMGPSEIIKYHAGREQQMMDQIKKYDSDKTHNVGITPAFSQEGRSFLPITLQDFEKDVLDMMLSKSLANGYLAELMNDNYFRQWMRLSIGTSTGAWFQHLLEDTLKVGGATQFGEVCQLIQNKLFDMTVEALRKRNNDEQSFEYDLHQFHRSDDFALLCNQLPGRLEDSHPGCVMLCLTLARMHSSWLTDALFDVRRKRNPELFQKKTNYALSPAEENSEVNRFLGWAIFSSMKKYSGDSDTH